MVSRAGGAHPAGVARLGARGGSNARSRTGRHHSLYRSTPTDGLSRFSAVGTLQRRIAPSRRHHESRQNSAARRMLVEAAWSYRFPARISRDQLLRQENLAKPIRDTAWKAQVRLCRRYRTLTRVGKSPAVVTTAIARELAGFVWAIAKQAQPAAA